jgi:hypothetical protein
MSGSYSGCVICSLAYEGPVQARSWAQQGTQGFSCLHNMLLISQSVLLAERLLLMIYQRVCRKYRLQQSTARLERHPLLCLGWQTVHARAVMNGQFSHLVANLVSRSLADQQPYSLTLEGSWQSIQYNSAPYMQVFSRPVGKHSFRKFKFLQPPRAVDIAK